MSSVSPTSTSPSGAVTTMTEKIAEGQIDTTETSARYLGLLGRIRPLLISSTRYVAYMSDIGEAFRPVVNRKLVTLSYVISISYVTGDIGYEGYKAHLDRKDRIAAGGRAGEGSEAMEVGLRVARRTVFQGLASIILPAITIHSAVKYSAPFFLKSSSTRVKGWGPTAVGLAIVPALPWLYDHPVETATDAVFDYIEENYLGCTEEKTGIRRRHAGGEAKETPLTKAAGVIKREL